jgi:hypothetical protein
MQNCSRRNEEGKRKVVNKRKNWGRKSMSIIVKRKEVHKIIRNEKNLYIKNVIELIKEDQKYINTRKMY